MLVSVTECLLKNEYRGFEEYQRVYAEKIEPIINEFTKPSTDVPEIVPELPMAESHENTNGKLLLLDFYAEWCGPCKTQTTILEDIMDRRCCGVKEN